MSSAWSAGRAPAASQSKVSGAEPVLTNLHLAGEHAGRLVQLERHVQFDACLPVDKDDPRRAVIDVASREPGLHDQQLAVAVSHQGGPTGESLARLGQPGQRLAAIDLAGRRRPVGERRQGRQKASAGPRSGPQ